MRFALDNLRRRLSKSTEGVEPRAPVEIEPPNPPSREELVALVKSFPLWYHRIYLGHGVYTIDQPAHHEGVWHHLQKAFPSDLQGSSVLDVGANAGYFSIKTKLRGAGRVVGLESFPDSLKQAELCRRSKVPIAGGELNGGWQEFKVMLEKGSYDVYQPDATMGGGIGDARKVLDACRERRLGYTPHTWTNGLGFLINLHVYAAGPRRYPIEYPYEPPGWVPEARDGILAEPIRVAADSTVALPDAPGLGIELDEDKLARYSEKYFEITSRGIAMKTVREKGLFTALRLARKRRR